MAFTSATVVRRSIWFHRAIGLAVALGVAAATAVVCGALLVGDSMRGSLRELTLQRLGAIDAAVIPGTFFNAGKAASDLPESIRAVPVIQFSRGILEAEGGDDGEADPRRSGNVQIVASAADFWDLDDSGVRPDTMPEGDQIVLNQAAADKLNVRPGDLVTVRLPSEQAVPADSPLGRRESESEGIPRLEVVAIVPNRGLGRFGLQPNQSTPLLAFLPLELVQSTLERPDAANALLIDLADQSSAEDLAAIAQRLKPSLSDFGLQLQRVTSRFGSDPETTVFDYYSLTSERLLISDQVVEAVTDALGTQQVTPVLTYLANAIETVDGKRSVPYSTISAIDSSAALPLNFAAPEPDGASSADEIPVVLNSWAAERLMAQTGDRLNIFYYEPETSSGRELERQFPAVVSDIVPVTKPSTPYRRTRPAVFDESPTVYNDPDLTPTVPGVTDQDSINDWDLPFQLEREVSRDDDDYWADYRLTPKAFLPLADGQRLFGSRFGDTSGLRIDPAAAPSIEDLQQRIEQTLRSRQDQLGFALLPIKAQQLAASSGTTPFDALFLSLSLFVIVAALMLVALLFRLGMEQRSAEYGTMMATGVPGSKVAWIALAEGAWVAVPGAILGVVAGIGYAVTVLYALTTFWVGAVTVPFLEFHWTFLSLIGGLAAGILMAVLTIWATSRRLRRADIRMLLDGRMPEGKTTAARGIWVRWLGIGCVVIAVGLGAFATTLRGPAQAGAFVGGGMLLLCGLLAFAFHGLTAWSRGSQRREITNSYSLRTLAFRSVGRNPLRSTLSIGLMAVACFLIVSMAAFQMTPTERGIGGFDLIGQSSVPIYKDLGDPAVRNLLLGRDGPSTSDAKMFGLRFRPGQEASCNNLYQANQPQVIGVPPAIADWYGGKEQPPAAAGDPSAGIQPVPFDWAAMGATEIDGNPVRTPWELLAVPASGTAEDPVPMILDQNTAMWSLQMRGGVGEVREFTFDDGRQRYFKVVALLGNTVLQGSLLIGETNFEQQFPDISGYSYFLIQASDTTSPEQLATILTRRLGDIGMDVVPSRDVLANLMAVQNTYLRTFQSLGALGLLLGTFGLAVVQMRNVIERRGELALMRAIGFSRSRLAATVMAENTTLLLSGIVCGSGAALAAVIPYFLSSGSNPSLLEPLAMLGLVLVVGLFAALAAVRRVLRMPLMDAI
jgi:ABC-type antimicrobial peptide transport system permease subunit